MTDLRLFLYRSIVIGSVAIASGLSYAQTDAEKEFGKRLSAAVALYRQGKQDDATKEFEELRKINPRSSDVEAWLGFLYLRANKAGLAVPLLQQAEAQRPMDLEVQINLGNALMAVGDYDQALDRYKVVMRMSPRMFEPFYNSGTIFLRKKAFSKAATEFVIASRLKPTDPFVQNNLGVAYEGLKDFQNSAKAFRKASDMSPENLTFAHNAGLALARIRSADALPYLEKALGDGTDAAVALALGDAYSRAGRQADALKYYEGLRVAEAKNPTFWFNLGVLRSQAKDQEGAEQAYRRALELNGEDLDTLNNLGLLLFRKGSFQESTTLFDKLAGLNPGSVATKLNLGASAVKSGDIRLAIGAWKDVLKVEPKRVAVRLDLANALWTQGEVDGARIQYLQVINIDRNNAEALNGIGLCYLKGDKLAQAEAAFRSSIEADQNLVSAYNNLAVTLQRTGHVSDAIKILEKAIKIAPNDEEIRRNLAKMRGEE